MKTPPEPRGAGCIGLLPPSAEAGLDPAAREELSGICRMRSFGRGATVLAEGEPPDFVGTVFSGLLRLQKILPDGRGAIVGLLSPGDMFGRVFGGPTRFAIEAATDVTLCTCPRRRLEALLARRPELEHRFLLHMIDELDASREWILLMSGRTVTERVATLVLLFRGRWPNGGSHAEPRAGPETVRIPLSRSDMAQYLGTRVETLSRTVKALVRAGVVEDPEPGLFVIRDLDALMDASGNAEVFAEAARGRGEDLRRA